LKFIIKPQALEGSSRDCKLDYCYGDGIFDRCPPVCLLDFCKTNCPRQQCPPQATPYKTNKKI